MAGNYSISVVIPCYNDSEWIRGAIESVIQQSYEINQIIVVDDGSTDNLRQTIADYISESVVQYVSHDENKGLPAARNTGIVNSTGDVVAFLDADDRWVSNKLEVQLRKYSQNPQLGMIYSNFYRVDQDGSESLSKAIDSSMDDLLKEFFIRGGSILPSSVVIPKAVFENVGTFDERLENAQETDMWIRIIAEYEVHRVESPLVKRTVRNDSLGSNYNRKFRYQSLVTKKTINRYPELAKYEHMRMSYLFSNRATYNLSEENMGKVRTDALSSIRRNPNRLRPYVILFLSMLPLGVGVRMFKKLKSIKNR